MYKTGLNYIYSPGDLNAFLENECVTWLDRYNLDFPDELMRDAPREDEELVCRSGEDHEARILDSFCSERDVAIINRSGNPFRETIAAMRQGREVIYQARLILEPFAGWADFLIRVPGVSEFGNWQYEVWDTKLARSMKPYFAIQLCCYAEMLEALQGRLPEQAGVILGTGERKPLRVSDYYFYYRSIKRAFLEQQESFERDMPPEFPGRADYGHWTSYVTGILEAREDLSFVANIRSGQIAKLVTAGIATMKELTTSTRQAIPGMARDTFERLRSQARLQLSSVPGEPPPYELLPEPPEGQRQGFGLMPLPSANDIAFDIEGYPMVEGGLEYLLGATCHEDGELTFKDWWAHDRCQERASFEAFIDWVHSRWKQDPSMHVYHYAAYETTALKRLMCRYASREDEVDELLRNQVFVDLYTVVRQALLIGEGSYSLKKVEHLYLPKREGEVATAGDSIIYYYRWLTNRDGEDWRSSATLNLIRDYNRADCESTWQLIHWLHERQEMAGRSYVPPEPPKALAEETTGRARMAAEMLAQIPADRSQNPDRWRVHELLAHLLEFHRREQKSLYWARFERLAKTEQELIDDPDCLGAVERTATSPVPVKQSFVYEYRFPEQESKLRAGRGCELAGVTKTKVAIESLDYERRVLTIKRAKKSGPLPERFGLIPDEIVDERPIVQSIERTVQQYVAKAALPAALENYLYRRRPQIRGFGAGPLIPEGEDILANAIRVVLGLDESTLCIQGPPGSGKTSKGGQIIAHLLKAGKRVGVSSNSHNAICELMKSAADAATKLGLHFTGAKCGEEDRVPFHPAIEIISDSKAVFQGQTLPDLVGGTAWVFSRPEAQRKFDYLFIDEAGQVSLAKLVGMAPSTSNLVLLGDQMQLNQPIRGIHPGESGASILDYYLQDYATVPEDLGIFLSKTWRMRPEICSFVSSAFYDGRLEHEPFTETRCLHLTRPTKHLQRSAGLVYVPVEHDGNTCESDEEVELVREVVAELLGQTFEHAGHAPRVISVDDILVVAPFNLQVRKLKGVLPDLRIGTVDKFQGQQAPIVVFSMTASEGDASPRGMEFLFDKNRLNVAISRAQILAVIVASSKLEQTRCHTLEQMQLVNLFCRAVYERSSSAAHERAGSLVA